MKLLALTTVMLLRAGGALCQFPFANQNLAGNIPVVGPKLATKNLWEKLFVVSTTTTVTKTTVYYCYSTDKLLGGLEKIRQCSERRRRAIEVDGIRGFIGEKTYHFLMHYQQSFRATETADEDLRSLIAPSKPEEEEGENMERNELQSRREARFLQPVTKTETETKTEYTATTAITMKCTPAVNIIPSCA